MYTNPAPPAKAAAGNAWKLGVIVGVLLLGAIFGSLVAVTVFGGGTTSATASSSQNSEGKSAFHEAFDASFKRSCLQSATRMGNLSPSAADSYCGCALSVFNQTHSMTKAAASCRQYLVR